MARTVQLAWQIVAEATGDQGSNRVAIIERAKTRIEEQLGDVRVGDLAEDAELSRTRFTRIFQQSEGQSPREYVRQRRIEEAMRLLETDRGLSEIAYRLGFCDQSHFTRVFKQLTGETPAAYRRRREPRTNIQDDEAA